MIGPECVAQQKKFVSNRMMNWGERSACPIDIDGAPPAEAASGSLSSTGGRRTRNDTGIMMAATMRATICSEVRQSWIVISHPAHGAMVIGALPMPAETSDTARLRWVSNQPVTVAIIGAKIAAVAPPTITPKMNWNASSEVAWLGAARRAALPLHA